MEAKDHDSAPTSLSHGCDEWRRPRGRFTIDEHVLQMVARDKVWFSSETGTRGPLLRLVMNEGSAPEPTPRGSVGASGSWQPFFVERCRMRSNALTPAGTSILPSALPASRFTVVCNLRVTFVLKSAQLRWSETGKFEPLKQSVAMGILSDCSIPL